MQEEASNGGRRGQKLFALQAKTTFGHRKSGKHERIRLPFKRETDCHTPYGGLACRLGRCFCFAEVSTGHPHRNDRATAYCTHHTVFVATKRLVILSAEHERIRNTLQKKETDCRSRLHGFAMTGSVRTAYRASRGIRNDKGGQITAIFYCTIKRGF